MYRYSIIAITFGMTLLPLVGTIIGLILGWRHAANDKYDRASLGIVVAALLTKLYYIIVFAGIGLVFIDLSISLFIFLAMMTLTSHTELIAPLIWAYASYVTAFCWAAGRNNAKVSHPPGMVKR